MPPTIHSHSRSKSPTGTESENLPPLSVNTTPADLLKMARLYEVEKNAATAEVKRLSCKLADITNDDNNNNNDSNNRSKRRRTRNESPNSDSDEEDTPSTNRSDEHFVYQAGHKFFLVHAPWIHSADDIFDAEVDDHYDPAERFENDENKLQGQLKEVFDLLHMRFQQQALRQRWLRRQFVNGLNTQQYNTATRICRNCASILGASKTDLLQAETRKTKFCEEIGWVNTSGVYSSVDVPILHKDWGGEYSLSSVFLNPKLMGVSLLCFTQTYLKTIFLTQLYIAMICGPMAGKHFMNGTLLHPQTETMARIHSIHNITPGAIATCGVLARWALSADESLQEVGSSTGIRYFSDYQEYLTILVTGLRQKKKSIINIIKHWDEKIFPDSESSLVRGKQSDESSGLKKAMDLLAADSEEEDGTDDQPAV
ncbi:hypothetical protein B0H34DRAFT_757228 [Crassisporium funariophilum]|nr:hypothetical protein B0H34DRAFT_757228 [Crassisporium funariophilum]